MFDFIFRRGNPTNGWSRTPDLRLTAALDAPALNDVRLGAQFNQLSFLGRNSMSQGDLLCYFDLGIGVACGTNGVLEGYMIVLEDPATEFQPFRGDLFWKNERLDVGQWNEESLASVLGDWYWLDEDDDEKIAFYEYSDYEMQIELASSGAIKRFILTSTPLLADPEQRQSYNVDKPWPPQYSA